MSFLILQQQLTESKNLIHLVKLGQPDETIFLSAILLMGALLATPSEPDSVRYIISMNNDHCKNILLVRHSSVLQTENSLNKIPQSELTPDEQFLVRC